MEKSCLEPKIDVKLNPPVGLFVMLLLSVYFLRNLPDDPLTDTLFVF